MKEGRGAGDRRAGLGRAESVVRAGKGPCPRGRRAGRGHSKVSWRRRAGLRGCPAPCAILHAHFLPLILLLPPPSPDVSRRLFFNACLLRSMFSAVAPSAHGVVFSRWCHSHTPKLFFL